MKRKDLVKHTKKLAMVLGVALALASLTNSVRHHQSAALAALYQSGSTHLPVCSSLISSTFRRFIFRTDRHRYTSLFALKISFITAILGSGIKVSQLLNLTDILSNEGKTEEISVVYESGFFQSDQGKFKVLQNGPVVLTLSNQGKGENSCRPHNACIFLSNFLYFYVAICKYLCYNRDKEEAAYETDLRRN